MLEKVNATNRRNGPDGHRRDFIGGSDARIIMGQDEKALSACGRKSGARSGRRTCRPT